MSQPNRLIHNSGLLSLIRCNTDHERTSVSPVTPPLVFIHLSYKTCSHTSSAGDPENFGKKKKKFALFPNEHGLFYFIARVIYLEFISRNAHPQRAIFRLRNLGNWGNTDIWVICEKTSQEFDILYLSLSLPLYLPSSLSFTDRSFMSFPSVFIWDANHCRKS